MQKGWLKIPGVQDGDRSLAEQMTGLEPALAACEGRDVYDFGCAEGLIGIEFAKRGAVKVRGCDLLPTFVTEANRQADLAGVGDTCRFRQYDLAGFNGKHYPPDFPEHREGFDIVLALAIVHKLRTPGAALRLMARMAIERLVIRLPIGSAGIIACKYDKAANCDAHQVMAAEGFTLEQMVKGPRGERVQHWVR